MYTGDAILFLRTEISQVIVELKKKFRKSWYFLRQRLGYKPPEKPNRLIIEKALWFQGAQSPVMLMVDDLTNAWHSSKKGDRWEHGGDWGGGLNAPGSVIQFLEDGLLKKFPEIKVTFFTVAGPISTYTHSKPFSYTAAIDADEDSREFFKKLALNHRYELAYHGFDHGTPGARTDAFVQEWQGFGTPAEAIVQTKKGLDIFSNVTGEVPQGGKYGGWDYNSFSDEIIDQCGFIWWCRDWMPRELNGSVPDGYYDPHFFGHKLVVALPSTIHGFYWNSRQIELLLKNRQIISIEEHIAPLRPDGLIQTPNIIDDEKELFGLFKYLRRKNVWYATGSEIASYVIARDFSIIYDINCEGFSVKYNGRVKRPLLTVHMDCSAVCSPQKPEIELLLPDGTLLEPSNIKFDRKNYQYQVNLPIMEGKYYVKPLEK